LYDLEAEIAKYRIAAEKAAAERENNDKALSAGNKWQGKYPMLRMMHALADHDEIKRACLTCHDLPSGQIGVENCNTAAVMAQNVWQLIADKWNDVLFMPSTNAMDCHSDFVSWRKLASTPCVTLLKLQQKRWMKGGGDGVSS
jgi:hypothetical protein